MARRDGESGPNVGPMDSIVGEVPTRWEQTDWRRGLSPADYQRRFDVQEANGFDVHGEATFVASMVTRSTRILDAGCGTGRVSTRLTALGYRCVGIDADPAMVAVAMARDRITEFQVADLATMNLAGRAFHAILLAGNVVPLLAPGTLSRVMAGIAHHLEPSGQVIAGFGLDAAHLPPGATVTALTAYDRACDGADLAFISRYGSWAREPFEARGGYAVSIHSKR